MEGYILMEWLSAETVVSGLALTLGMIVGWMCRTLWNEHVSLKAEVNNMAIRLPTDYVRRSEFETQMLRSERATQDATDRIERKHDLFAERIENKLDKIYDVLQAKADK